MEAREETVAKPMIRPPSAIEQPNNAPRVFFRS
jgi:hypothetical protein